MHTARRPRSHLVAAALAGLSAVTLLLAAPTVATSADPSPGPDGSPVAGAPEASAASAAPEASDGPAGQARRTFDPSGLRLRTSLFVDGLETPVYVTDDGTAKSCLYIVQRNGIVRLATDGLLRSKPFLDISKLVKEGTEQGLHAIAFHPDFADNGRFFAHYNDEQNRNVIAEFKGSPCGTASSKVVKTLLAEEQAFPNNNAGWLGFGPDGYLYIPLGDGGGVSPGDPSGIGQTPSARLSKVLRIDVDVRSDKLYAIPKDNPYAKKRRGFAPETWAMGLRDPRRASFDRKTGDLWIGDQGQDSYEEVDRLPAGKAGLNFGWSDMEGDRCHNLPDCDPSRYEPPLHVYDSVSPQCGVVGGYVYRGRDIPGLEGVYLFSDFCSGYLWGIDADAVAAGGEAVAHQLLDASQGFVSFGQDDDGELYLVALDGSVYRLAAEEA
jgi:glucose/arabinose dehydrogenase